MPKPQISSSILGYIIIHSSDRSFEKNLAKARDWQLCLVVGALLLF
jgi:hypothetical protein